MSGPLLALLVEDDTRLAKFTADYLVEHEVEVTCVTDGDAAVLEATRQRFDVILLDLMLPRQGGLAVCKRIRERSDVPIVMVTARVEEADRILGLESGADDYVIKPFSPRELLARMHALVRRDRGDLAPKDREIRVGGLTIHPAERTAVLGEELLVLTSSEFDLLTIFAERPGRVLSRSELLRLARGNDAETFDRAIDVQISRLRQKLSARPQGVGLICTVRGVGYMLAAGSSTC